MTDQPPVEPHVPQQPPLGASMSDVSGGVNIDAQRDVSIGGDVVGRDKITQIVEGDKVGGDKIVEQQVRRLGAALRSAGSTSR